jgi:hypothetical protein
MCISFMQERSDTFKIRLLTFWNFRALFLKQKCSRNFCGSSDELTLLLYRVTKDELAIPELMASFLF